MADGGTKQNGQDSAPPPQTKPWSFFLVLGASLCITVIFLVVWLTPVPKVFTQSSQVIAALTATFGVIGTLVGTYFGVKSSSDARDTVERVQRSSTAPLREAAERAADAADATRRAAEHTASAADRIAGKPGQPDAP
jgi:hypothetical protein